MGVSTRVLVTGASGFVGAAVVRLALTRGHDVTALVGPDSSLHRLHGVVEEVEVATVDITDSASLESVVARSRPDACIHLAAAGAVVREDDLDLLLATNVLSPALLARALAGVGCARLVTAGSSSEYGTVAGAMREDIACRPDDPYGVAKLAGGLLARVVARDLGLATAHLRLFSVYGPGEDGRRLVPSVVDALLARRPIALTPGAQVRDFVYVDDAAAALVSAIDVPDADDMTVNVGSGVETSVRTLCTTVADLVGGHALLRFGAVPYRPGERFAWRADTERASRLLGWSATTPLEDGLSRTVEARRDAFPRAVAA